MNFARQHTIHQFSATGNMSIQSTQVIGEQPVLLTVNGEEWVTLMCTPIQLEALGIGFLYNEGVIKDLSEVEHVRVCPTEDNVDIWLGFLVEKPKTWFRTSGCTGGQTSVPIQSIENETIDFDSRVGFQVSEDHLRLTPGDIMHLTSALFESQEVYKQTGGVHTSALSDGKEILIAAEDVGRHNTLDKIAGRCLLEGVYPNQRVILTTGRISSEMLQKTSRLGASILISRTAPTTLSIQLAQMRNITLIGYARRNQFNVYTHPERIQVPETDQIGIAPDLQKQGKNEAE
jgi:FdhD protein